MKDRKSSHSKRNQMIINLIQTPAGYSVIEGTELLNKPQNQSQSVVNVQSTSAANVPQQQSLPAPVPVKEPPKMNVKQNTLLFLKAPSRNGYSDQLPQQKQQKKQQRNYVKSTTFATWFDYHTISQVQKNQVVGWTSEWSPGKSSDANFLNAELNKYKHYRNLIVDLYYLNYAPNNSYMSASSIRKYLCDDARWLMKIHMLLTSWGIINSNRINFDNQKLIPSNFLRLNNNGEYDFVALSTAFYTKGAFQTKPSSIQSQNQTFNTLKKITSQVRPYCDFCGIHCEMVWFQHIRVMDPKQISTIMKNVNSKNPPLSEKEYEIILCTKCYCNGNFPLLLTHHDFRKISVNDRLEPGKKKKEKKGKKKDKKRKQKYIQREKNMAEEQEEEKEQADEIQQDASRRQKDIVKKEKQKQKQKEEEDNENEEQKQSNHLGHQKQRKQLTPHVNGVKDKDKQKSAAQSRNGQPEKQTNINEVIQQIVGSVKKEREWSLKETNKLLQLIAKHGDDWDLIYKNMVKAGYCQDCDIQSLILYFVRLPQMNVSSLYEQSTDQTFIDKNKGQDKSEFLSRKIQRNLDNWVKINTALKPMNIKKEAGTDTKKWKELLDKLASVHMQKIDQKVLTLTALQRRAVQQLRNYEEATKQICQQ